MSQETFLVILLVGCAAGIAAHLLVKRGGLGLVGDVIAAVAGAIVTGFMLPTIGLSFGGGPVAVAVTAAIGAVGTLAVLRKLKRA